MQDYSCSHEVIENGYCEECGENIYTLHTEVSDTVSSRANIEHYFQFIDDIKTLSPSSKSKIKERLSNDPTLHSKTRQALKRILQIAMEEDRNTMGQERDYSALAFEREMIEHSKEFFNRKNVNQVRKSLAKENSGSDITITSPLTCVTFACKHNGVPELISEVKQIITHLINCDKDKEIFNISPEIVVISILSLLNDERGYFKESQNSFAKRNSTSPTTLKTNKQAIKNIMLDCQYEITP